MTLTEMVTLLAADPDLYARVMMVCEPAPVQKITCSADGFAVVRPLLMGRETEALVCVALSARHAVIETAILTTGSADASIIDPRQILRWALTRKRAARSIILAHNHPSGDATPSAQDIFATRAVQAACRVVGLTLLDHVIVTDTYCESMASMGYV